MNWFLKSEPKAILTVMYTAPIITMFIIFAMIVLEFETTLLLPGFFIAFFYMFFIGFIWEIRVPLKLAKIAGEMKLVNANRFYFSLLAPFVILGITIFGIYFSYKFPEKLSAGYILAYLAFLLLVAILFRVYRAIVISKLITSLELKKPAEFAKYKKYIWSVWIFPFSVYQIQPKIQVLFKEYISSS